MRSLPNTSTHDKQWESNPHLLIVSPTPYPLGHSITYSVTILIIFIDYSECVIGLAIVCIRRTYSNNAEAQCVYSEMGLFGECSTEVMKIVQPMLAHVLGAVLGRRLGLMAMRGGRGKERGGCGDGGSKRWEGGGTKEREREEEDMRGGKENGDERAMR